MIENKLYGNSPDDLGFIDIPDAKSEMMYYLYLPIKVPGTRWLELEDRLMKYLPLLEWVAGDHDNREENWYDKYIYFTVKTLYVSPGNLGQRPGWHSDGFMTDDINYIWYTDVPTVFWIHPDWQYPFLQDHELSMIQMNELVNNTGVRVKYPNKHLLRLDETVIHKPDNESSFAGIRTFVKISVSEHIYALEGNSRNHNIDLGVEYSPRQKQRNCPVSHKGV